MNILLVSQYFVPEVGAPQIRLFEICKTLLAKGNKVTVVTGFPNYPSGIISPEYRGHLFYREKIDGLQLVRTWIYPFRGGGIFSRLLNYFSFTFSSSYKVKGKEILRGRDIYAKGWSQSDFFTAKVIGGLNPKNLKDER